MAKLNLRRWNDGWSERGNATTSAPVAKPRPWRGDSLARRDSGAARRFNGRDACVEAHARPAGLSRATGTSQLRQSLCDLLWEGPDDPRAALRWSLTKLRPLVNEGGVERLRTDRERVAFTPEDASIDIRRCLALLSSDLATAPIENIEEAAALLQGEFLDGLDMPACYRFHHWCLGERERWAPCGVARSKP